ncbi:DUF3857 and transglutaminase domain-containing protein [Pedobacter sp. P351]|uniref:DUF3857 and transglutaminase domain-containing protein n=1 Tax=Pedobacter superstes TaxID=3133441 RepID=UPI003098E40E
MKFIIICISIILLSISVKGQISNFSVASIPKPILPRSGAVVRNSETIIEVKDLDEVYYRKKYAITILNSSALEEASVFLHYDKNTIIKSVKGAIYDESGILSAKITEKNFQDRSSVSDFSLYEDDRIKYFIPSQITYPFTIEYEYEIKTRQSLYFPAWIPGRSTGVSIEKSSLNFICPEDFKLRYKEYNYQGKVEEITANGTKNFKWEVYNIHALREEPYSPNYEEYLVTVKLAPEKFAFKNIKGRFSNWAEYGIWTNNNLLKGRDELPQATKDYITSLIKNVSDPKEKAKKIYEFVQNKTRYVSVQIGIGGYQPSPAADVDRLSYGDCKGLVNYMHSLLKIAGIESYYSIVYAGSFKRDIAPDFTSMDGNHIILCLPFKNDTTWLECTDKFAPFGFLGDFTDDRYAVACTPEGGKIMRTPKFPAIDNKQLRKADFKITSNGSLTGTMTTRFSGTQYDNHHMLLNEAYSEQMKKLSGLYPLPNITIQSLQFTQDKGSRPETKEIIALSSENYCSITEGKLRVRINGVNKTRPIREISKRTNPVKISRGYYDEDVITYQIPEGYKPGLAPNQKIIEKPFGKYSANVKFTDNTITYSRKMLLNEGSYKAEEYQELVDFFQEIADADSLEIVLDKKI